MILEIRDVDQKFRSRTFWMKEVQILHSVSMDVPERSIFGFLGANGAGKTTLIQLIVGLRKPTAGTIRIKTPVGMRDATSLAARSRIGYLPERPYFYEHLTGSDFLKYFGALSGMSRQRTMDAIPKVLSAVGMLEARNVELGKFSKGMLQRIGIAQALLHEPELLILDEPMSGLDPLGRKEMRELILRMAAEGRTVFFSTHVIPDVEAICDRVALINKGRMAGCGPIEGFLKEENERTEIVFTNVSAEVVRRAPEFAGFREASDGFRGTIDGTDRVQSALKTVLGWNGKVVWVNPVRPSLEAQFETVFARPSAGAGPDSGDKND